MRTPEIESVRSASALTPSDTVNLARITRAITLGVAGDITVDMADGSNVTIKGLTVGRVLHGDSYIICNRYISNKCYWLLCVRR